MIIITFFLCSLWYSGHIRSLFKQQTVTCLSVSHINTFWQNVPRKQGRSYSCVFALKSKPQCYSCELKMKQNLGWSEKEEWALKSLGVRLYLNTNVFGVRQKLSEILYWSTKLAPEYKPLARESWVGSSELAKNKAIKSVYVCIPFSDNRAWILCAQLHCICSLCVCVLFNIKVITMYITPCFPNKS